MPTITTANVKGGSGKSTTTLVLAMTLLAEGASVRIIDADPRGTVSKWGAAKKSKHADIVVTPPPGSDLTEIIDDLAEKVQFVFVDVQGSANKEISEAMSRADFVLIPLQPKEADAEQAADVFTLLRSQEKLFRRQIRHALAYVRTSPAIITLEEKQVRESAKRAGLPCLEATLVERAAFSRIHADKLTLEEMDPSILSGLEAAKKNAKAFAREFLTWLMEERAAA
ncbi:AAA family ATPase [Labrys sp. 22185]|uniref:AAA family ATPase n=1 Tax=Labrys sp. 22185 TaxID=3453888 RepID=UPI003F85C2A1